MQAATKASTSTT